MAKSIYQILIELEGQERARAGIEQIGTAAGLAGAALTAFSVAAAKVAMDYEQSMAAISTISTEATGSTEQLTQQFGELSSELNGMLNKKEAADSFYDILSSGFTDNADALGILSSSQKAATAGFSDLTTVSTVVAGTINAYGDSMTDANTVTEKAAKVTDMLLAVQDNGVIKVGEYARSIGQLIPIAAASGTSLEEMNAAIATATLNTVPANQAITGLRQVIAAIQKPSGEAAEAARKLGIEFGPAALQAKGLEGVLRDVSEAGGITSEYVGTLFGSVEAATVALAIAGENMDTFSTQIDNMGMAAGRTDENFAKMTDTSLAEFKAAVNQVQNALIDLGTGVMVGTAPVIEAVGNMLEAFSKLDPETKAFIGQVIAITGVSATLVGGLLLLTATFGKLWLEMKAGATILTSLMFQLSGVNAAQLKLAATNLLAARNVTQFTIASRTLAVTLAPMAATVVTLTAAVGALALAYQQYQNIKTQERGLELQSDLQETEVLAQKISELSGRMRESGKAIPQEEWDKWIAMLKAADNGTLTSMIGALERQRTKLVQGAEATEQSTQATQDSTEATEEARKELEEYLKAQDERVAVITANAEAEISMIEATTGNEQEALQKTTEIRKKALADQIAIEQEKLTKETLTANERQLIQAKITQLQAQALQVEQDTTEKMLELAKKRADESAESARLVAEGVKSELEARKLLGDVGGLEYIDEVRKANQIELDVRRKALQESLQFTEEGSIERARIESQLTQVTLEEVRNRVQAERDAIDEIQGINQGRLQEERAYLEQLKEANEISDEDYRNRSLALAEQELSITRDTLQRRIEMTAENTAERSQLEAQLAEANLEYTRETTQAIKEELDNRLSDLQVNLEQQKSQLQGSIDLGELLIGNAQATTSYLNGLSSVLDEVGSKLKDENISAQERSKLNNVAKDTLEQLRDLGLDISSQGDVQKGLDEAKLEIAAAQLQIKKAELQVEKEMSDLKRQQQAQQLRGEIQIEQIRQSSGTLSEAELLQSQLKVQLNQQSLSLLNKEQQVADRGFALQNRVLDLQTTLATGGSVRGLSDNELNDLMAPPETNPSGARGQTLGSVSGTNIQGGLPGVTQQSAAGLAGVNQATMGTGLESMLNGALGNIQGLLQGILQAVQGGTGRGDTFNLVNQPNPCQQAAAIQEARLKSAARKSK